MADFDTAVKFVLQNEGPELVRDPNDPGGLTKFGISQRAYPRLDIAALTEAQASQIYRSDYWQFDFLASQALATKLLDLSVNFGKSSALKLLQCALKYLVAGPVVVDGIMGPLTSETANAVEDEKLLPEVAAQAVQRHCQIVLADRREEIYLMGWLRRDMRHYK
ncbi:MAG: glycoside hydrolase family 108 protein [Terriglobia bacterium]